MTEGFIAQLAPGTQPLSELTEADLAAAHAAVILAYQKFWQEEENYQLTFSTPENLTREGPPLRLKDVPEPPQRNKPKPPSVPAQPPLGRTVSDPKPPRRSRVAAAVVAAAVVAIGIAIARGSGPTGSVVARAAAWAQLAQQPAASFLGTSSLIAAAGPDDIWVSGQAPATSSAYQMTYRWDGTAWRGYRIPVAGSITELRSSSASNTWALVSDGNRATFLYWNSTAWVAKETVPFDASSFALAGTALLAFGPGGDVAEYERDHWTTTPVLPGHSPRLYSVSAAADGAVWAIGSVQEESAQVLTAWSAPAPGDTWQVVSLSAVSANSSWVICARSAQSMWVLGPSGAQILLTASYRSGKWVAPAFIQSASAVSVTSAVPDETGGAWLTTPAVSGDSDAGVLHYTDGKLTTVAVDGYSRVAVTALTAPTATSAWALATTTEHGIARTVVIGYRA